MRFIDLQTLLKRRKKWGNRKELWKNKTLSNDFRMMLYRKCWYTEASLAGSDTDIDHYRPKSRVSQYKSYNFNSFISTTGYDWLKNDPSNYRCSCIYANRPRESGGKRDFFPLETGSPYGNATSGCTTEKPLLLDPCVQADVNLIMYDPGGKVKCTSSNPTDCLRVEVSKELYNWDNVDISTERSTTWYEVERIIQRYINKRTTKEDCIEDLRRFVSKEHTYSACAISCVQSLAPDEIKSQLELTL